MVVVGQPAMAWDIEDGAPAQLVVRDAATLSPADNVLRLELLDLGYRLSVVDDNAPVSATSGTAVVVLSTSVEVAALGSRYKSVEAPLVALGNNAWPETGLTAGTDGTSYDTTSLVVLDTTHPVATGLPAQFAPAVSTGTLQSVNEAFLPGGADPVAARAGELAKHVVYTVPAGGALRDGYVAPAPRVVLGYTADTVRDLSAAGYQLLENALFWADDSGGTVVSPTDPGQTGTTQAVLKLKGRWNLDEIRDPKPDDPTSPLVTPSATTGADRGVLDSDTTVTPRSPVALVGAHSLYFPGWHHDDEPAQAGVQVNRTDSSVRIPHREYFNPLSKQRFVVSAYVRPDNPTGGPQQSDATPNIMQKGLRPDPNGQWKMSMDGTLRPACEFRGRTDSDPLTDTVARIARASASQALTAGSRYRIECEMRPEAVYLRVFVIDEARGEETRLYTVTNPNDPGTFVIDNTEEVWIGKKPNDPTVADTYAGSVDNVTIRRTDT